MSVVELASTYRGLLVTEDGGGITEVIADTQQLLDKMACKYITD
jgi:hypothetical protein